jgi:hypothetical protein
MRVDPPSPLLSRQLRFRGLAEVVTAAIWEQR